MLGVNVQYVIVVGSKPEHFAKIAVKNHKHSVNNSLAQFQTEYTLEQVMNSKKIHNFLTMLQCRY